LLTLGGRAREGANGISLLMKFMKESERKREGRSVREGWKYRRSGSSRSGERPCSSFTVFLAARREYLCLHLYIFYAQ